MATHRITYRGPASLAVSTATRVADAEGVALTGSEAPQRIGADGREVVLAVTVEGATEAIEAAVARARADLPPGATLTIDGA
jgi:hypothetical protein